MDDLRREARAIHRAAFGRDPSGEVERQYIRAHEFFRTTDAERAWMARAVDRDLEALEIVLRLREPGHVLCRKVRLLVGIAEGFPDSYGDFVNERPRRLRAFFALAGAALRTARKYLKGRLLVRRLGGEA